MAWTDDDYRNWRKRIYRPVADAVGVDPRAYDLRHSFVSLLVHEGVSIVEVARQAGHSPEECLRTYAHTFEEFDPTERLPAATAIAKARQQRLGPNARVCTRAPPRRRTKRKKLALRSQADGRFEPATPALRG